MEYYEELHLKNGGRREFWVSHTAIVAHFVETHAKELTKVEIAGAGAPAVSPSPAALAAKVLIWDPTHGGMKMPHFHFGGDIYLATEAQWGEFAKAAVNALTERLGKVQQALSFEGVLDLSDAVAAFRR